MSMSPLMRCWSLQKWPQMSDQIVLITRCGLALLAAVVWPISLAGAQNVSLTTLSIEGLAAWQGRNDVEVPNDGTASRFALDELTGEGPVIGGRVELAGQIRDRHEWRVLLAPLSLSESGVSDDIIDFQGERFAAGPIDARYQFNSWRVTWRYRWIDRPDLQIKVGFTAKVRDASIGLRQAGLAARKDDTGFVPLLHGSLQQRWSERWSFEADIDALGGGPGYAVDLGAGWSYALTDDWRLKSQIRFLDGGADNDKVYAFARFTSVTLGVVWRPR